MTECTCPDDLRANLLQHLTGAGTCPTHRQGATAADREHMALNGDPLEQSLRAALGITNPTN